MRRPKKPLRSPFVVTVAGAMVACGGSVSGVGSNDDAPVTTVSHTTDCGDVRAGQSCSTGDKCGKLCTGEPRFVCQDGKWSEYGAGCNPPSPCPSSAPSAGSACTQEGVSCSFPDACELRPKTASGVRTYACTGSAWKLEPPGYTSSCPSSPPSDKDSCGACADSLPPTCEYPTTPDCPPLQATCDPQSKNWMLGVSTCNPPPVDAGGG